MGYSKADPQPGARDAALAYEDIGPGLYPDETAVKLDTGELVAVSVRPEWLANGSGVALRGWARWIDADGRTHLCPSGQDVELEFCHTASAVDVAAHGVPALAAEVLKLLLGEEPAEVEIDDGTAPLIGWSPEVRLNASIRHAITSVAATKTASDAGALLGLPASKTTRKGA